MSELPTIVFLELVPSPDDSASTDHDSVFASWVGVLATGFGAEVIRASHAAVTLRARSAGPAVDLAATVVAEVAGTRFYPPARGGLDTPVAPEGLAQTEANARAVSALADPGQVLLTETTRESAGQLWGVQLHDFGRQRLERRSDAVELWAAIKKPDGHGPPR